MFLMPLGFDSHMDWFQLEDDKLKSVLKDNGGDTYWAVRAENSLSEN